MSSSSKSAQSMSEIFDPIYAYLDKEEFLPCIQYIMRNQSTILRIPLGSALLAYAHASGGNRQTASEIGRKVMYSHFRNSSSKPMDESILNTLACTFKQLRSDKDTIELYESAVSSGASYSEAIYLELFYAYARKNDLKGMQHSAQRIYKTFSAIKYMCWVVGCIVLQVKQQLLPITILALAEKMMSKYQELRIEQQKSDPGNALGGEEIILYVHLLMRLGKLTDCMNLLSLPSNDVGEGAFNSKSVVRINDADHLEKSPHLVSTHPLNRRTHRIDILLRLHASCTDFDRKNSIFNQIINELHILLKIYPDQWNMHHLLVSCVLSSSSLETQKEFPDYDLCDRLEPLSTNAIADASKILHHQEFLRDLQISNPKLRGPYLAELLLLQKVLGSCISLLPLATTYIESNRTVEEGNTARLYAANLVCQYVWTFRYKQCCFSDLRPFIFTIFGTDVWLLEDFLSWLSINRNELKAAVHNSVSGCHKTIVVAEPSELDVNDNGNQEEDKDHEDGKPGIVDSAVSSSGPSDASSKKKKKKKKKKAATTTATASQVEENVDAHPELAIQLVVEENSHVILAICAYCKLDQLYCFTRNILATLAAPRKTDLQEVSLRVQIYNSVRALFVKGVGGEVRNAQPGDELILENSSSFRLAFERSVSQSGNGYYTHLKDVLLAIRWTQCLLHGIEASYHSYGFKVDVLDPLRILSSAQIALVAFNGLGAKYIQLDTMSYLILPCLTESGLFNEAARHHRQICNFHVKSAQKETFENMGRCFELGNYLSALDLQDFATRCSRSYQLALSRAELPLLDLLEGHYSLKEALSFLEKIEDPDMGYVAAQPLLLEKDLDDLIVNMDYNLLIRSHGPLDETSAEAVLAERRSRMRQRVQIAQFSSRILLNFLKCDMEATEASLASLHAALQRSGQVEMKGYLQYDPTIHTPMQNLIWKGFEDTVSLFMQVYRHPSSTAVDVTEIFSRLKDLMASFQTLRNSVALPMLPVVNEDSVVAIDITDVSLRVVFSPDWLKTVSFMCSTICSWIPLMLQSLLQDTNPFSSEIDFATYYPQLFSRLTPNGELQVSLPLSKCDWNWTQVIGELERQSTSGESFSVGETVLVVAEMFLQIFGDIRSELPVAPAGQIDGGLLTDSTTANLEEYFLSMEKHFGIFESPENSVHDIDADSSYRQYLKQALDSILSSHSLSFARLQQVIDAKITSMIDFLRMLHESKV